MIKKNSEDLVRELEKKALELRLMMVKMLRDSGASGHYGGGMSIMDILTVLYFGGVLRVDPANPDWEDRDRFVLSKGHACVAFCPVLAEKGFFSHELLTTFNKLDSPFGMHPDMNKIIGCDMSTGSLGHGAPVALGMALAGRYLKKDFRVYGALGDGEIAEGSNWESFAIAAHFKVDNLCFIVDRNGFSCDGLTEGPGVVRKGEGYGINGTLSLEPLDKKLEAFGCHVIKCDGHDIARLLDAYDEAASIKGKPTVIIADTIKGKGISFIENKAEWHYGGFDAELTAKAIDELTSKLEEYK